MRGRAAPPSRMQQGEIDIGVIVVPSDRLQVFLPDRNPRLKDAVKYVEEKLSEALNLPIIILAIKHDGSSMTA